jgi:hypothetical protein
MRRKSSITGADQECGDAHDQNGENEHRLASDTVAIVAKNNSADWSRNETNEKSRIGQ